MIARPQLLDQACSLVEQQEQRPREEREHAVVGDAIEIRMQRRAAASAASGRRTEFSLNERCRPARPTRAGPTPPADIDGRSRSARSRTVGGFGNDRRYEVVLHAGEPAVLHVRRRSGLRIPRYSACWYFFAVGEIAGPRNAKLSTLNIERSTSGSVRAMRAYECRCPRRAARVVDLVFEADAVHAAVEHEGLGDRDAIAVGPGERHAQLVLSRRERVAVWRRS